MMKSLLLTSASALAFCVCGAAEAGSAVNAFGVHRAPHAFAHHAPPKGAKVLYDQNSGTGSDGFFSQAMSSYPQFDEYLADDFTVPKGKTWKVTEVDVGGFYYFGPGPASSVNVLFWNNSGTLPDGSKAKVTCDDLTPTNGLSTGAFEITLPKTCKAKFKGGKEGTTYWVTVQANMKGISTRGWWAWDTVPVHGNQAAGWWYGSYFPPPGCYTSFQTMSYCTGATTDLSFELLGTSRK
jgi:hypothetical protein